MSNTVSASRAYRAGSTDAVTKLRPWGCDQSGLIGAPIEYEKNRHRGSIGLGKTAERIDGNAEGPQTPGQQGLLVANRYNDNHSLNGCGRPGARHGTSPSR